MKHLKNILFSIFLISLYCFPASALDAPTIFKNSKDSVVLLMSFDENSQPLAIGSGFFIHSGENLVSNFHVVNGASSVKAKTTSGKVFEINEISGIDIEHDLIIFSTPFIGAPLLLSDRVPEVGEDIFAIGNPKGLESTLSMGIISGVRNDEGSIYYQITASISPGSSGGPIIDETGKVLGVSTFYVEGGQNLNFSVPSAYVKKLLRTPDKLPISTIIGKKQKTKKMNVDERVKIIEPFIADCGRSATLQGSVVNRTDNSVKNIRLVALFFPYRGGNDPVHYMLIKVEDTVPPGLAARFERTDETLFLHGDSCGSRGKWRVYFRVLDYDILEGTKNKTIPAFQ